MLGIRLVWVFFIVAILQSLATASDDDEKEKKNMLIGTFCNNQTYEQIPGMVPKGMIKAGAYSIPAGISSAHACAIECCGSLIGGGNSTGCDVALFQKGICYHLVCKSVDSCSPIKDDALKTETIFIAVSQVKSIWESSTDATTRNYLTTAPSTTTTPKLHTTQKPTATHKLTIMEMSKKAIALPKTTDKIMTTTASVELNHSELLDSIESSTRLAIPQDNFCNTTQGCPAGWECLPVIINQTEKSNFPTSPGPPASEDIVTKKCRKRLISTTGLSGRPTTATNTTAETMSKPNQQPQADILNAKESYTAGTSVVFDGQGSDPDGDDLKFEWKVIEGPIEEQVNLPPKRTLHFDSLKPGNYTIKLTVSDGKGGMASDTVSFVVLDEVDSFPQALAGECGSQPGSFEVQLPVEEVYICGNYSTDDKGIMSYTWLDQSSNSSQAEVQDQSLLVLKNLHPPYYKFKLEVTDTKNQKSSYPLKITVLPEKNHPPIANGGENQTVTLPENIVILNGQESSDDHGIKEYFWTQIEGPKMSEIVNKDQMKATASKLVKGVYKFELNVTDANGLSDAAFVFVTVLEGVNNHPVAICSNKTVSVDQKLVTLDASQSKDDAGIVSYKWTPLDANPAAMDIVNQSDEKALLMLTNLGTGVYLFNLTVTDGQGSTGSQLVNLTVSNRKNENELIEAYLGVTLEKMTLKQMKQFQNQLELFLSAMTGGKDDNVKITVHRISQDFNTGRTYLQFTGDVVTQLANGSIKYRSLSGLQAVELIKNRFPDKALLPFAIDSIDTKNCQNDCSNRGICNDYTKLCTCEKYWMPNYIKFWFGLESNCDWSVFYVLVVIMIFCCAAGVVFWFATKKDKTRKSIQRKKKSSLLSHKSQHKRSSALHKGTKNGKTNSLAEPLLLSENSSDYSSQDEDSISETKQPSAVSEKKI